MRVNTRYIISTKGTSSKVDAPQWHIYSPFQAHSATQVYAGIRQNQFDSGLWCCAPCLSSAISSLCLWILHRRSRPHSVSVHNNSLWGQHVNVCMCVFICSTSFEIKDYVQSQIKIGSVVCLYTPVSPSVPQMEGIHATGGFFCFVLRMYLWCSSYTLYLLARQVELP